MTVLFYSIGGIVLCLGGPEFGIFSLLGKETVVISGLDDPAVIEYGDLVAEAAGGQAVILYKETLF